MKVWAFDDAHNWGSFLVNTATARGHDAHLFSFETPRAPDFGYAFMHMHHHPNVRLGHKRIMATLAMNPELTLIPGYRATVLYDDKVEQARQFARWMPRTNIYHQPGAARAALDASPNFPFISKGAEGAGSHNVRKVATLDDARLEIRQAFSDLGIKSRHGQTQRGYLLWQEYIEGTKEDVRVLAIGSKRLVLCRTHKSDQPNAGAIIPVDRLSDDTLAALAQANAFFDAEQLKWAGVDLVKDAMGRWHILEMTVSWVMHNYYECRFFDSKCNATDDHGIKVWDVMLDELERGEFAQ